MPIMWQHSWIQLHAELDRNTLASKRNEDNRNLKDLNAK